MSKNIEDLSEFRQEGYADVDKQLDKVRLLCQKLCNDYSERLILAYLDYYTDIVPKVLTEWLNGKRQPSIGIRQRILGCLQNFDASLISKVKASKSYETALQATGFAKTRPTADRPGQPALIKRPARPVTTRNTRRLPKGSGKEAETIRILEEYLRQQTKDPT